jgi:hypothetical protein
MAFGERGGESKQKSKAEGDPWPVNAGEMASPGHALGPLNAGRLIRCPASLTEAPAVAGEIDMNKTFSMQ